MGIPTRMVVAGGAVCAFGKNGRAVRNGFRQPASGKHSGGHAKKRGSKGK